MISQPRRTGTGTPSSASAFMWDLRRSLASARLAREGRLNLPELLEDPLIKSLSVGMASFLARQVVFGEVDSFDVQSQGCWASWLSFAAGRHGCPRWPGLAGSVRGTLPAI